MDSIPASPIGRRLNWFGSLDLVLALALMAGIGSALWVAGYRLAE
jgi:hypothetical protein